MKLSWHERLPRLRPFVGLFVIIASVIVNVASPYAVSAASSYSYLDSNIKDESACTAAGGSWTRREGGGATGDCMLQSTPKQNAETFLYAGWLADCLKIRNSRGSYDSSQISSFDISLNNEGDANADFGFITGDDDGQLHCDSGNARAAATALGYTDFLVVLDAIGCKKISDGGRNCSSAGDEKTIAKKLLSMRYGSNPTIDGAAQYYFYHTSFVNACVASPIDKGSVTSADTNDANSNADTSKKYNIKDYDPKTKGVVDAIYAAEHDKGSAMSPVSNSSLSPFGGIGDSERECRTLANMTNQYIVAYKKWADLHSVQAGLIDPAVNNKKAPNATSKCTINGGIGWIVCPVMTSISFAVDKIYGLMQILLATPPLSLEPNADKNPLYGAWSAMRNIANILFVIAFLFIIYSQITGMGASNYGVKKMLPKLIIGAILINVSFWVCALAVDLSNLLGVSLYNFLSSFGLSTSNGNTGVGWSAVIEVLLAGAAAGGIAFGGLAIGAAALGGGGLVTALLWLAVPLLISVAIALLIGVTVLALRQALIIILIFIAPVAFAAYLLPNTQGWFDKWRKLFTTMLVFYPLFSLLFGGASIASRVLLSTVAHASPSTAGVILLTGMTIQFLPLFLVPMLIKTSSGLLGKVAGRMQGGLGGMSGGLTKMARGRTAENMGLAKGRLLTGQTKGRFGRRTFSGASGLARKFDTNTRTRKLEQSRLDTNRESDWQEELANDPHLMNLDYDTRAAKARGESAGRIQTEQYTKTLAAPGSPLAATAGGIDPHGAVRTQAAAIQAEFKAFDEHVSAEKALLSNSGVNASNLSRGGIAPGSLDAMVRDSSLSVEQRAAAASRLIQTGADNNIHELLDYLGTTSDAAATTIQKQVGGDLGSRKPKSLGQADVSALTTGTYGTFAPPDPATGAVPDGKFDTKVIGRIENGKQSGESLAAAGVDELARMETVLSAKGKAAAGSKEEAARSALSASIDEYYISAATSGRQVPNDIKNKMDSIKGLL